MAISEIGVSYPDDTFGKESRFGIPFTVCWEKITIVFKSLRLLSFTVYIKRRPTIW